MKNNNRLRSRRMWVALIAMFLIVTTPFIAGDRADAGSMVSSISMIAMIYLGGQGAIDAVSKYKSKEVKSEIPDNR